MYSIWGEVRLVSCLNSDSVWRSGGIGHFAVLHQHPYSFSPLPCTVSRALCPPRHNPANCPPDGFFSSHRFPAATPRAGGTPQEAKPGFMATIAASSHVLWRHRGNGVSRRVGDYEGAYWIRAGFLSAGRGPTRLPPPLSLGEGLAGPTHSPNRPLPTLKTSLIRVIKT